MRKIREEQVPHLYVIPPQKPLAGTWKHDYRDVELIYVQESGHSYFVKIKKLGSTWRISLLTTPIDLILNHHKRLLLKVAEQLGSRITKSNLGKYLKEERGLKYLLSEKELLGFKWHTPVPKHLEIGSGNGAFLNKLAGENPDYLYLGTEINGFVIKKALRKAEKSSPGNIYFLKKNAEYLLNYFIPERCLDAIYINFPDPWVKKRHKKRKFINDISIGNFAKTLKPGGPLTFATDDAAYAKQTKQSLCATPFFKLKEEIVSAKPQLNTKYEKRWLSEGKNIYSLTFLRTNTTFRGRDTDPMIKSFRVHAQNRFSSGFLVKEGKFTVIFKDVYRGEKNDLIDTVITLGRFTWFVLFTYKDGYLHYSPELNHKFLTHRVKEYLERLLS